MKSSLLVVFACMLHGAGATKERTLSQTMCQVAKTAWNCDVAPKTKVYPATNFNQGNPAGILVYNGTFGSSNLNYPTTIVPGTSTGFNSTLGFNMPVSNPNNALSFTGFSTGSVVFVLKNFAYKSVAISYASKSSTGAATSHAWSWSTTGVSYTLQKTLVQPLNRIDFVLNTLNFTNVPVGKQLLYLKLTMSNQTNVQGAFNKFDNIQIAGLC